MTNIDLSATGTAAKGLRSGNGSNEKLASIATRPAPSNSASALKLLTRSRGATIAELAALTGWQPHSVRAHLSGLRKKGIVLLREARKSGEGSYRVANAVGGDSTSTALKDGVAVNADGVAQAVEADIATVTAA